MKITRRHLLSLAPAAGLMTIAAPSRADAEPSAGLSRDTSAGSGASSGPGVDSGVDDGRLLSNTVQIFAGTAESNARPETAQKLAGVQRAAHNRLDAMDAAGDGELFSGLPLGSSDSNLSRSYRGLDEIALAIRAPGTDLHEDAQARGRVLDGLAWLHERYYGDQSQGYYGNWFHWEIGISRHVSRTLTLLADHVDPDLVSTYVASMDAYLRHGKDGDVDLDSRFHTGANLADITANRVLQGALLGDDARIAKALDDQGTVFATIDPYQLRHGVTDGYYADGSFIQHHSVAYTGSYGKGLLTRVVQMIKILDGTSYAGDVNMVSVVEGWVRDGFAPLIFEGWMMDIVKGRAVSRTTSGYANVADVVEAVVDLSEHASGAAAEALKSYVKHLRSTSRAALDPTGFVSPVSIVRYTEIVADERIPPADLNPASRSVAFNAMDRTVHRRPGYAFALARSSDRISKYEYMSGENLMPWFQGDGAYHLCLSGQDQTQAYGVDYLTTVSPYRLAGVTAPVEERKTIPQLYGKPYYDNPDHQLNFTPSSESQNTYVYFPRGLNRHSGGAVLGAYGAAAMVQSSDVGHADKQNGILPDDFVVYQNATATKSWFMLDDEIVVLAADVGDSAGRAVTTAVDSRIAAPSDELAVTGQRRDGSDWPGAGWSDADRDAGDGAGGAAEGAGDLRWLRYANATQGVAVGYVFLASQVFLDSQQVSVDLRTVTRSRRVVRASNPDTTVSKQVFSVWMENAAGAEPSSLAYVLAPNASEAKLRAYHNGPLTVVANNRRIQAIKHTGLGLRAVNVFASGWHEAAGLSVDGPTSVIAQTRPDGLITVAASDPTMERDTVSVLVRGRWRTTVSADEGVRVSHVPGGARVEFPARHAYGRSFTVTMRGD